MAIQILGGKAKGLKLQVIESIGLRPTSVMLRRKVFDKYQTLNQFIFVDIFAGTGSMAIEAWSRGCSKIFVNEIDTKVFTALKYNISKLKNYNFNDSQCEISRSDAKKFLNSFLQLYKNFEREQKLNCILFIDPPYEKIELYEQVHSQLCKHEYLGKLWIESDYQKGPSLDQINNIYKLQDKETKCLKQGSKFLLLCD